MPNFTFYQDFGTLDYTPEADVALGAMLVLGSIVAFAHHAIPAGTKGAVTTKGIITGRKVANAHEFAHGEVVYLDLAAQKFTHDANGGANIQAGHAAYAETAASEVLKVDINA